MNGNGWHNHAAPLDIHQLPRRSNFEKLIYRIMPPRRDAERACPPGLGQALLVYGWREADMPEPAYAPPVGCPCMLCGRRVGADDAALVDLPFVSENRPGRVYFYVTHQECIATTDDPLHLIDAENAVAAMIARSGD